MFEKLFDLGFRLITIASWVITAILLLRNKATKSKLEKKYTNELEKAQKNKEAQKAAEEVLKDMATFLCDRCAKPVKVKEGQTIDYNGTTLDVCANCAEYLNGLAAEIEQAQQAVVDKEAELTRLKGQLLIAQQEVETARARLQSLSPVPEESAPKPADPEEKQLGADNKILEKLGIKG